MLPIDQQIVFLYTRDLEKTSRFYEGILGLSLALDRGDCRIWRVTDTAYLGCCQRENAPQQAPPQTVILTLVTPEVEAWYERLRAQGVAFEQPPTLNDKYQITHCFLRDPNGYLIEIQRFEAGFP